MAPQPLRLGAKLGSCRVLFTLTSLLTAAILSTPGATQPLQPASPMTLSVVRASNSGRWETAAAEDLAKYLGELTGQSVPVTVEPAKSSAQLTFVVGEMALRADPALRTRLASVAKKNPVLRADAVVVHRDRDRIFLAGSNDDSHYFAVTAFLQKQGCRWYLPTPIGECIPRRQSLDVENVELLYAPPFEVRTYWISWNGDSSDYETFAHRNFYNLERGVVGAHTLDEVLPKPADGKALQLNSPETVRAAADALAADHALGKPLSLGISDSTQAVRSPLDKQLSGGIRDKFFYTTAAADTFLPFYNAVCAELWRRKPESQSKIGFLAYTNLTLPPQRDIVAATPLIAFLAPIDIDPNHALTDPRSPERLDLLGAVRRWTKVMQGRVILYDYDQGMMVWRDVPNPSHAVFAQDVKTYRKLGILGFATESRNAIATTFTNLFFRGQLMWNPEFDVDAELALFYRSFYGPAAGPMQRYWSAIYRSVAQTAMVDHEYYIIPALFPKALIAELAQEISLAQADEEPFRSRLAFTKKAFQVLRSYTDMTEAGAVDGDYPRAEKVGREGLLAREELTASNGTFTTYKGMPETGPAWWPGEVESYAELAALTDGRKGKLLAKPPLVWSFKLDPFDEGVWRNWGESTDFDDWGKLSTGILPRAQGVYDANFESPIGYGWYACQVEVPKLGPGETAHLMFPGLFSSSWLYLNGHLVDWHEEKEPWWATDYSFRWDLDVGKALRPGLNTFILRTRFTQHPSGLFRRPVLYRKAP